MSKPSANTPPGLHVLAKPIGPVCDIACEYCFYLEKQALFGTGETTYGAFIVELNPCERQAQAERWTTRTAREEWIP